MPKVILGLLFLSFAISMSGCQTMKNTAAGMGGIVCGFGKGLSEDAGDTWKAINNADEWFKENCW